MHLATWIRRAYPVIATKLLKGFAEYDLLRLKDGKMRPAVLVGEHYLHNRSPLYKNGTLVLISCIKSLGGDDQDMTWDGSWTYMALAKCTVPDFTESGYHSWHINPTEFTIYPKRGRKK